MTSWDTFHQLKNLDQRALEKHIHSTKNSDFITNLLYDSANNWAHLDFLHRILIVPTACKKINGLCFGRSPLFAAVNSHYIMKTEMLLWFGADPRQDMIPEMHGYQMSALHIAVMAHWHGNLQRMTSLLLSYDSDLLNLRNNFNFVPRDMLVHSRDVFNKEKVLRQFDLGCKQENIEQAARITGAKHIADIFQGLVQVDLGLPCREALVESLCEPFGRIISLCFVEKIFTATKQTEN